MAKTVNYTPEMTATMVAMYTSVRDADDDTRADMVNEICALFDKRPRSVRAKLSREGVYIAKQPVSKVTGETPAKKAELANRLREVSGANINPENVAKMNKTDIARLIEAFENLG